MLVLLIVMTGLMAGVYFVFSVVIMKSLGELPPVQGAQAMNKINDVIINTLFLPIFFGSTLWFLGLIVWAFADWQTGQSLRVVTAALVYIVGMFLVTAFGNVPLNNRLKQSEADEVALAKYWAYYQNHWTRLNHLRTPSCMAACALLTLSLGAY
ncbi:DUF1772 domain-containing protein [Marinagarivorans cellulosilyticus]|uniref:DUF1772 domain-containing protein n=1 Tax=Marinagarivorans cellulosilyticus TaxID=2721545 RepID=A0AAN1WLJ7_9GAMM|nr:anthrone oxygenase family protein [Marinagarivorans cellulosilyticus]BCD99836.1 hypothetical protein MARGE09_P4038 [Marinagarivorans cellulosilyticus]